MLNSNFTHSSRTGGKSLFSAGRLLEKGWINEVTDYESEIIKAYFLRLISREPRPTGQI